MMKRITLFFLILANVLSVKAQKSDSMVAHKYSDRLSYSSSIGIGFPLSNADDRSFSFQSSFEYHVLPRLSAGVGTGIEHYNHTFLPLYATLNWNIVRRNNVVVPLLSYHAGYSVSLQRQVSGGLYLAPSAGVIVRIKGSHSLLLAVGYELHNYQQKVSFSSSQIMSQYIAAECNRCISVKVGYVY